jgi:hypothetical protein
MRRDADLVEQFCKPFIQRVREIAEELVAGFAADGHC